MKAEKDIAQGVEKTLQSLHAIQRVQANPDLYNRITGKLQHTGANVVSMKTVWLAAASIALLFAINTIAISSTIKFAKNHGQRPPATTPDQLNNTNFEIY